MCKPRQSLSYVRQKSSLKKKKNPYACFCPLLKWSLNITMYVICVIPDTLQPSTEEFNLKWTVGSSWWPDFVWHHLRQRWCKLCFVWIARKPEIFKLGLYHWWSRKLLKTPKVKWLNVLIMFFHGDWKTYWVNAGNFGIAQKIQWPMFLWNVGWLAVFALGQLLRADT